MKRIIAAALLSGCVATSAVAGGFATIVEEPDLVEVTPNSSSGGWIPVVIMLALVAVAASADD